MRVSLLFNNGVQLARKIYDCIQMPKGTRSRNGKPRDVLAGVSAAGGDGFRGATVRRWGWGRSAVRGIVGIGLPLTLAAGVGVAVAQHRTTSRGASPPPPGVPYGDVPIYSGDSDQADGVQAIGGRGGIYTREVLVPAGNLPQEACVALDARVMEHAGTGLEGMTLTADGRPEHFALTLSSAQGTKDEAATIENFALGSGAEGKQETGFDLKMPVKTYDSVTLDLRAPDFVTVAEVAGSDGPRCHCARDAEAKKLGEFVIFDLSRQGAPRQTTLRLGETHAPYLHVTLRKLLQRGELTGAMVAPSRAEEVLFTKVASTNKVTQVGGKTVATIEVPGGIPLERVEIQVGANAPAFRRAVTVEAVPAAGKRDASYMESFNGYIQRIHEQRGGQTLDVNQTTLDSVLMTNENGPARISVTIDNAGAAPLPVESVAFEMRRRSVCFQARPGVRWELYYGGSGAEAAGGVGRRTLIEAKNSLTAVLGGERLMIGPVTMKPVTWAEKYPALRWIFGAVVLGSVLALLLRGMRRMSGHPR